MKKWTSRKRTAAADQTKKQQQQRASNATGEGDEEYENGSNTATESSCSSNSTDTVQTDYERLDDDDDDDDNNNRNMSNTGNTNNNDNIISSHYKSPTYDEEKDSTANDSTASTNLHLHTHNQQQNHHQHPSDEHIIKEVFQFLVRRSWKKKLCTLLVVLSTIPVLLDIFILRTGYISSNINNFLHWMMTHPILGVFAYIALLIATSLIFLPPSVLIFASGFIFTSIWPGFVGIIVALLASYIASTIGGLIGFVRAKYMTRDLVKVFMRR